MKIDTQFLDTLSAQAKESPRLRQNFDLRTSPEDNSQRMLNALEMGTVIQIHRHTNSTETMVMVRGSLKEMFYDDEGNVIDTIYLTAEATVPSIPSVPTDPNQWCRVIQIPVGQWHSIEVLEPNTVIFEAKDGAYKTLTEENIMNINSK